MNTITWILIVIGTLLFACLFDLIFRFVFYLFSDKTTTDMAEASRIKWWEHSTLLQRCHRFFHPHWNKSRTYKRNDVRHIVPQDTKLSDISFEQIRNVKLKNVGQLVNALKQYNLACGDYDIMFWGYKHLPCYPTSIEFDVHGRICLRLKSDDGVNYNVSSLLQELQLYDENVEVYVAARGCFLNIKGKGNSFFYNDTDIYSDNDVIACDTTKIGEYEE